MGRKRDELSHSQNSITECHPAYAASERRGWPGSSGDSYRSELVCGIDTDAPVELFDKSLDGALKTYSPLVVDCWELGCWPCQKMDTTINQMASDFRGKIVFGKLCTDFNPVTTGSYGISRTPTLLIFSNGTLIYKHVGNYPRDELENIILTVLHMR